MGTIPGDYHGDEDFIEAEARLGDDEYELGNEEYDDMYRCETTFM